MNKERLEKQVAEHHTTGKHLKVLEPVATHVEDIYGPPQQTYVNPLFGIPITLNGLNSIIPAAKIILFDNGRVMVEAVNGELIRFDYHEEEKNWRRIRLK